MALSAEDVATKTTPEAKSPPDPETGQKSVADATPLSLEPSGEEDGDGGEEALQAMARRSAARTEPASPVGARGTGSAALALEPSQLGNEAVTGTSQSSPVEALSAPSHDMAVQDGGKQVLAEPQTLSSARETPVLDRPTVETLGNYAVKSVRYLVSENERSLQVRLNPPALGKLQVEVVSTKDALHVRLVSGNVAVREALESQVDGLRDTLARDGLDVVRLTVAPEGGGGDKRRAIGGTAGLGIPRATANRIARLLAAARRGLG